MLASRGFIYPDEESDSDFANRFHSDDRCIVVASRTGIPKINGYEPGKWRTAYDQARAEVTADGYKLSDRNILQRMRDMNPTMFSDSPQVPSILRDHAQGWPETFAPIPPKMWINHILYQHEWPNGRSGTQFVGKTHYQIAKIVRETAINPDLVTLHHINPYRTNHLKEIDGVVYVVGRSQIEPFDVFTSFPPGWGDPTMKVWQEWISRQ